MSEYHRKKLAELVAESKRLLQHSILINQKLGDVQAQLAEVQNQIEARTQKLLDGKPSSHEMEAVDPEDNSTANG